MKTAVALNPEPSETIRPAYVLVGPPGVGKTTIGKLLAERLELLHQDSDDAVVEASGMSIPQIFEVYGEPEFRSREVEAVCALLNNFNGVVSLGGGAVMAPETQRALTGYKLNGGLVVYLDMNAEAAGWRLHDGERPLLSGSDVVAKWQHLTDSRRGTYSLVSSFQVDTSSLTPFQVVEQILMFKDLQCR